MKRLLSILLLLTIALPELLAIQSGASTQGSEFYFSFFRGREKREKTLTLYVSSPVAGVLELTNPRTGTTATYPLSAGLTSIPLATTNSAVETSVTVSGAHNDCYTVLSETPQDKGYYAHATDGSGNDIKVSLYASLSGSKTADAANVYPVEALGNEYYVISRSGNSQKSLTDENIFPSQALIVAAEECDIEIYPTCILDNGGGNQVASKIDVHLLAGQTYLLRSQNAYGKFSSDGSTGTNDLTGTRIVLKKDGSGNECKKIAVFAGTQHGSGENSAYNNGDYEYDQLFPVHLWGERYIVGSPDSYGSAVTRVVASQSCTDVSINGNYVTTLNASEFYEYKDVSNIGCYVETTKPVGVAFFTTGQNTGSDADGAPAMITVAPIEQMVSDITFNAIANSGITEHSVMITALTSSCDKTTLTYSGGSTETLSTGWQTVSSNPVYSYYVKPGLSTSGTYTLHNNDGFNAYVYGSKGNDVGYGYSAGSAAIVDELSFNLDTIKSDNLSEDVCVGDQVSFKANLPSSFTVDNVEWKIWKAKRNVDGTYVHVPDVNGNDSLVADETQLVKDTVCKKSDYGITYSFPEEMKYVTRMIVTKTATTCYSTTMQDSVTAVYNVRRYYKQEVIDTTVCYNVPITIARRSELSSVPESQMVYRWYEMSGGVPDLSSNPAHDKNTLTEVIAQGTTKRGFVLYTNDVSDPCNVYVDTVLVTVPTAVSVTLNVNGSDELRICNDGSVTATLTATMTPSSAIGEESLSYTWNKAGLSGLTPTPFVPTSSETVTFTATVRNEAGDLCSTAEKSVDIKAFPVFTASLAASSPDYIGADLLPMSGGYVTYTVTTSVGGTYDYVWHPSGPNTGVMSRDVTEEVTYYAEVWDSEHLCTSTTNSITTKLGIVKLQTLVNPLMLSDGFGNKTIDGALLSTLFSNGYKLYVFDRYGKLVSDTKNEGWSSEDMRKADAGVYFYLLEYNKSDGNTEKMRGSIEIIKN